MQRIGAILLMGGDGKRFGSELPKQLQLLGGKKVFTYALETLIASGLFHEIVLVCHPHWMVAHEGARSIPGGATRQQSSYRGLHGFTQRPDIVLIHDAVRPFVSERILRDNVALAIQHGAADTCIPSADTLVHAPGGQRIAAIPPRAEYQRGQTPQTFRYDWILEAHEQALVQGVENASDDCQLALRMGRPIWIAQGEEINIKITTELDLSLAESLLPKGSRQPSDGRALLQRKPLDHPCPFG
jgi:2-C-methyl-D-erythritol 4-phosphate cytidylyltransferase